MNRPVCYFPVMRKQNAKQRIMDTAGRLFALRGYGSVGINEIIETSETAKASFYNHFPSKEHLCAAWLGALHQKSEASHDAILTSNKDPLKIVQDYFDSLKAWIQENQYRGCPYTNTASALPGDAPLVQEKVDEHKIFIRDFFIELARKFTDGKPARQLGNTLFLIYSGATTESQNLKATWPVDVAAEVAIDLCRKAKSSDVSLATR
jgi:AcrR family transcriptional regulator